MDLYVYKYDKHSKVYIHRMSICSLYILFDYIN